MLLIKEKHFVNGLKHLDILYNFEHFLFLYIL